jgi:hypothetical protein
MLVCEVWVVVSGGRLGSAAALFALEVVLAVTADATETAEDRGAVRVFFIREKRAVTRVYDDWSFSSSSEKGLKEVKLVTSSTILVLLRDLDECPANGLGTGEDSGGSSMVWIYGGAGHATNGQVIIRLRSRRSRVPNSIGSATDSFAFHSRYWGSFLTLSCILLTRRAVGTSC